jgi:hypothetical protein
MKFTRLSVFVILIIALALLARLTGNSSNAAPAGTAPAVYHSVAATLPDQ